MKKKIISTAMICLLLTLSSTSLIAVKNSKIMPQENQDIFGLIILVNSSQNNEEQTIISRFVNVLLESNITTYWNAVSITVLSSKLDDSMEGVKNFEKGCFIVPFYPQSDNDFVLGCAEWYEETYQCKIFKIKEEIIGLHVYQLKEPKIAHFKDKSVNSVSYPYYLEEGGFRHHYLLKTEDIVNNLTLENYDVFIWAGQKANFEEVVYTNINLMGIFANLKIRRFVSSGGGYVGSCYGSYKASLGPGIVPGLPTGVYLFKITRLFSLGLIDRYCFRALPGGGGYWCERVFQGGGAGVTVRIVNSDNPVSYGLPEVIHNNEYIGGPLFLDNPSGESNTDTLAVLEDLNETDWNWDAMMECTHPLWNLTPGPIKELVFSHWVEYSTGKPLWVTSKYGEGKIVGFSTHPEFVDNQSPPRIIYNAIFYVTSKGPFIIDV